MIFMVFGSSGKSFEYWSNAARSLLSCSVKGTDSVLLLGARPTPPDALTISSAAKMADSAQNLLCLPLGSMDTTFMYWAYASS